jgi:5-methylcytosine-specific restriction protein A
LPDLPPYFRGNTSTKQERGLAFDKRRAEQNAARKWYSLAIWRRRIRPDQLAKQPLCERCKKEGKTVEATIVNHVGGHGGAWDRFIAGPFESLCKPHHDGEVQREEKAARSRGPNVDR